MNFDDDDHSFSIHDLDNAPEISNSGADWISGTGDLTLSPSPRSKRMMMTSSNTIATQKVKNSGNAGGSRRASTGHPPHHHHPTPPPPKIKSRHQSMSSSFSQFDHHASTSTSTTPDYRNSKLNQSTSSLLQRPNVLGSRDRTWSAPVPKSFYPAPPSQGKFLIPQPTSPRRSYSFDNSIPENNDMSNNDLADRSSFLRRARGEFASSTSSASNNGPPARGGRAGMLQKSKSARTLMSDAEPPRPQQHRKGSLSQSIGHLNYTHSNENEQTYLNLPELDDSEDSPAATPPRKGSSHGSNKTPGGAPTSLLLPPPDEPPSSELSIFESEASGYLSENMTAAANRRRLGSGDSRSLSRNNDSDRGGGDHSHNSDDENSDNGDNESVDSDERSDATNEGQSDGNKKFFLRIPNLHQISSWVVMYAPCFWLWYCCSCFVGGKATAASRLRQPTDRAILARLNVLVGLFTLFQIGSALFLMIVTLAPNLVDRNLETQTAEEAAAQDGRLLKGVINVWNTALAIFMLGIIGVAAFTSALLTIKVVRTVNLVGAIRYLWALLWILPFEIYFVIGLFDYFRVTGVWVDQYWRDPALAWFRKKFCKPSSTANTLCTVPLGVNETDWCLSYYNSTSCTSIRDGAQTDTESWLLGYYWINAAFGVVLIALFFLVINTLENIISKPLVQKSRQSNIPAWLALPVSGCIVFGIVYSFARSSVLNATTSTSGSWIGPLYLVAGGLFFLASGLGWYISWSSIRNSRHKRNKLASIIFFISLMGIVGGILIAIFAFSITFSSSFVDVPLSESTRGDLACVIDQAGSCTNCTLSSGDPDRCPEWTTADVTTVIQTQAKSSATLAAIFFMYALSAFRFGLGMRQAIRMYQIDYV